MKRRLLIRGSRVQDIGYRMFLLTLASEHGLTGFQARNVGKDEVEAVYEGPDDSVRAFESDVRELAPGGAEVEDILFEDYDGPVMDIERFRSYFTTLQLGKMIEVGLGMLSNQEAMIQKLDAISRKQDETLNELSGLRADLRMALDERLSRLERDILLIKERLKIEQ